MTTPAHITVEDLPVVLKYVRGDRSRALMAEESGVSSSALEALENGDANPTLETLEKLARYLGRPIVIEPGG